MRFRCAGAQCHYVAKALNGLGSATAWALCARFYAEVQNVFLYARITDLLPLLSINSLFLGIFVMRCHVHNLLEDVSFGCVTFAFYLFHAYLRLAFFCIPWNPVRAEHAFPPTHAVNTPRLSRCQLIHIPAFVCGPREARGSPSAPWRLTAPAALRAVAALRAAVALRATGPRFARPS